MTIAPRWRKVLGDIAEAPARTSVAVLAMAAGIFGLAAILTPYSILGRELATTFTDTRPASAVLSTGDLSDADVEGVRALPGVGEAEIRGVLRGRLLIGEDEWAPLVLFVVRDFDRQRVDRFLPEAGSWPPADDEILLERTALSVARASIGDTLTVRVAGGAPATVRLAGSVHAAGLAPAWMDHVVTGFVGWGSILRGDRGAETMTLRLITRDDASSESRNGAVAATARRWLEERGTRVTRTLIPAPGRHPHADQMDTFLYLLGAFGALTIVLGAILVANLTHALLARQVRQVGVMKAIGATSGQIARLYLTHVAILAAAALALAMPLGYLAGRAYARFSADMLNATLASEAVSPWVVAIEILAGVTIPLAASLAPVAAAARMTIHEAFGDGAGRRPFGESRIDAWLARIRWLTRPARLSLRTALQRRGRLALTLGTLGVGGAVFISALNLAAAWTRALDADARARRYDVHVRFAGPTPIAGVTRALGGIEAIERVEYWPETGATLLRAGSTTFEAAADESSGHRAALIGPIEGSRILDFPLLAGRWLEAGDRDAAVVNPAFMARAPGLRIGDEVVLGVEGRVASFHVVGMVKELYPGAAVYAPAGSVLAALNRTGETTGSARIVIRDHDDAAQLAAQKDLDRALRAAGIEVQDIQRLKDARKAFADHLVIIQSALLLASGLVLIVGGLGLASTLTLNVIERTREMGILGAIGATPRAIARQILAEGIVMGLLSWVAALGIAVPITLVLCSVTGRIFIRTPIDFAMSGGAAVGWLALVLILAGLSSAYPARRAALLSVREALAYE